jgi:hypothetical protein
MYPYLLVMAWAQVVTCTNYCFVLMARFTHIDFYGVNCDNPGILYLQLTLLGIISLLIHTDIIWFTLFPESD